MLTYDNKLYDFPRILVSRGRIYDFRRTQKSQNVRFLNNHKLLQTPNHVNRIPQSSFTYGRKLS